MGLRQSAHIPGGKRDAEQLKNRAVKHVLSVHQTL